LRTDWCFQGKKLNLRGKLFLKRKKYKRNGVSFHISVCARRLDMTFFEESSLLEVCFLQSHRRENLKSYKTFFVWSPF
jgi:hypothetical protein